MTVPKKVIWFHVIRIVFLVSLFSLAVWQVGWRLAMWGLLGVVVASIWARLSQYLARKVPKRHELWAIMALVSGPVIVFAALYEGMRENYGAPVDAFGWGAALVLWGVLFIAQLNYDKVMREGGHPAQPSPDQQEGMSHDA